MATKREKMLAREKELEGTGTFGLEMLQGGAPNAIRRMMGDTGFGTSIGPGATYARNKVSDEEFAKGKNLREMEPTVRQAMREAAQEEQREASRGKGMKTGGSVSSASKRADGIAMRGKTRGKYL